MLDNWQRIEKIVNWTGLSVNAFAHCIGLKRAENLYQIRKGNYGISKELAEMIVTKYPTVSKSWLLTGAGNIFLDDNQAMVASTPFYRVDIVKLMLSQCLYAPSGYMSVPLFGECDLAALNVSTAMEPEIPYGAVVFIRKTESDKLLPGGIYLIMGATFKGIRYIRREPDSPILRLVPQNKADYDEVAIREEDVDFLYEIKGYLISK